MSSGSRERMSESPPIDNPNPSTDSSLMVSQIAVLNLSPPCSPLPLRFPGIALLRPITHLYQLYGEHLTFSCDFEYGVALTHEQLDDLRETLLLSQSRICLVDDHFYRYEENSWQPIELIPKYPLTLSVWDYHGEFGQSKDGYVALIGFHIDSLVPDGSCCDSLLSQLQFSTKWQPQMQAMVTQILTQLDFTGTTNCHIRTILSPEFHQY